MWLDTVPNILEATGEHSGHGAKGTVGTGPAPDKICSGSKKIPGSYSASRQVGRNQSGEDHTELDPRFIFGTKLTEQEHTLELDVTTLDLTGTSPRPTGENRQGAAARGPAGPVPASWAERSLLGCAPTCAVAFERVPHVTVEVVVTG